MTIAVVLLLGSAVLYALLMGSFAVGLRRAVRATRAAADEAPLPFVSVLLPARDEEATISACLHSILASTYPKDRYEVIVIDDGSRDATARRVREVQHRHCPVPAGTYDTETASPIRLLPRHAATGHKQAALLDGLAAARGELILTTDADCTVSPDWIRTMVASFTPDTGFVAGPVRYRAGRSWWRRWQALEFAGLIAVGAGSIGLDRPTICSSANVAYRRAVADEELAQRLAASSTWKVRFCTARDAAVTTTPATTLRAFWEQRQRWALTGARFDGLGLSVLVAGLYAFYLLMLGGLLTCWMSGPWSLAVLLAFTLKCGSEATLLHPACRHFGVSYSVVTHGLGQLLQIPYIVLVSAMGVLAPPRWKDRPVFS